jgi:hypothetical protein
MEQIFRWGVGINVTSQRGSAVLASRESRDDQPTEEASEDSSVVERIEWPLDSAGIPARSRLPVELFSSRRMWMMGRYLD